ncbi:MAG TPA: hypothetical protein VGD17_13385 [Chitinophagaceae bacterium]
MKKLLSVITCLSVFGLASGIMSFNSIKQDALTGAWHQQKGTVETVWVFVDGYAVQATYDKLNRKFMDTWGGPYTVNGGKISINTEFNTANSDKVGQPVEFDFTMGDGKLSFKESGSWTRLDNGTAPLAGNWRISGRMQDGKMVEIKPAARKTLKILSGTRFQWIAINPEVRGFYGTGGGTYTFTNGKYTEKIEFFSRDSTRVGASLTFDGKVENKAWNHSGLNSRGEPLNEIWSREGK